MRSGKIVEAAGYKFGIYCNVNWYTNMICSHLKKYDFWIARYPASDNGIVVERLRPDFGVGWQYSSKAVIPGISTKVDRSVFYKDYAAETKKEDTIVSTTDKLKEFTDLGDFYAGEGTGKPYLEKKTNAFLDDFQETQDIITTRNLPVMSTAGAAGMPGTAMVCGIPVLEAGKSIWTDKGTADYGWRFLQL